MSITLECPECGKKFEFEDSMAGRKAACECGAILFIPDTPDAPAGKKSCPKCAETADEEAVLCVKCGYNFQTGGRMRSADSRIPDEEENPKIVLARRLVKPAALIIILSIVAFAVHQTFFAKHFGISSSAPLGTKNGITNHLLTLKYAEVENSKMKLPDSFPKTAELAIYLDKPLAEQSRGLFKEKIRMVFSKDGKALCVAANFRGGVKTIPGDTGSKTGRFMVSLWREAGGPLPPKYEERKKKNGYYTTTFNSARFAANGLKAEWIECPSDISIIPSSHTMIIYSDTCGDLTYEDITPNLFSELRKKTKKTLKKKNFSPNRSP